MHLKNSPTSYGSVAVSLHWLMAILLIFLIAIGIYMVNIPISLDKLKLYGWHKEYGLLALALVIFRIIWRYCNVTPYLPLSLLERIAARTVHWTFYVLMFALPITGWLMTSAAGLPASFFGLFVLPDLIDANESNRLLLQSVHAWLGYILIAVIILHTAAALKHHFINKDDILKRMLS